MEYDEQFNLIDEMVADAFSRILSLNHNLHGLVEASSSLDNQVFNWFSVVSVFDMQGVIIHLHQSLGFVAKFQFSLF